MTTTYDSSAIEVLTGLEPVRKRPGMYTTTERPNHLAQEVIDNSADEAIAGYCDEIVVTLHDDGSLSVADNGRGMPVDKHAKEGVIGRRGHPHAPARRREVLRQELSLLRRPARRRRLGRQRAFEEAASVGAPRRQRVLRCRSPTARRSQELKVVGQVGKRNTGTTVRFWADETFFDSPKFNRSAAQARHAREGGALARAAHALHRARHDPADNEEWFYEDGLTDYLMSELAGVTTIPGDAVRRHFKGCERRSRLGGGLAAEDDDDRHRELREPDPDRAGRHARQRIPHRTDRSHSRVLRVPQPPAARREARAGRCLGALQLHPVACA